MLRRNRRLFRVVSIVTLACHLGWLEALAGPGPDQPEFQSFSSGPTELVDPFSGDFTYTIPLLEVPGPNGSYPIALSYRSAISMEEEASWVGLGWSLNPGVIARQVRGLPDDFCGGGGPCGASQDLVTTTLDMKPARTYGANVGADFELFGFEFLKGSVGAKLYYNNYRGFGITQMIGMSGQLSSSYGLSGSLGVNLSLDTQEGLAATPSLSLGHSLGAAGAGGRSSYSVSGSISFIDGLKSLSFNQSQYFPYSPSVAERVTGMDVGGTQTTGSRGDLMGLTGYAGPTSIPSSGFEMSGWNVFGTVKLGLSAQGAYPDITVGGFFTSQSLQNAGRPRPSKPYGYLYLDQAGRDGVLDFQREKDGPIYDNSPNLAIPLATHDLYNASGDGITGTFRAYRNDIPILFDREQKSKLLGGGAGGEIGFGLIAHWGLSANLNYSETVVGRWDQKNDLYDRVSTINAALNECDGCVRRRERFYFEFVDEPNVSALRSGSATVDDAGVNVHHVGGDGPVSAPLRSETTPVAGGRVDALPSHTASAEPFADVSLGTGRAPRKTLIQAFTNDALQLYANALPEFKVDVPVRRLQGHHIGGFIITRSDGTRYVYAIPVYNHVHEEYQFSASPADLSSAANCALGEPAVESASDGIYDYKVDHSDEFLKKEVLPPYPTSYLLTAILGPDYVDVDSDGASDPDLGFWVKLTYQEITNGQAFVAGGDENQLFKWRAPYKGVAFARGYENGAVKYHRASYTYGARELWYLSAIETKTHRAEFDTESRKDARGAVQRIQQVGSDYRSGLASRSLKAIRLKRKGSPQTTLQTTYFQYDHTLAPGVPNFNGTASEGTGKLTLKKVWTEYKANQRGRLSPYEFQYSTENPDYDPTEQDGWGRHRPIAASEVANCSDPRALRANRPFTPQPKSDADRQAAAWNLVRVVEPSSRKIDVQYESDEYAYVQNKAAMRLFGLDYPYSERSKCTDAAADRRCAVLGSGVTERRIFIATGEPLSREDFERRYIPEDRYVYFKIRVNLGCPAAASLGISCPANAPPQWEHIAGYAVAEDWDVLGSGDTAWIRLKAVDGSNPLEKAARQHLRVQQPDLVVQQQFPFSDGPITSKGAALSEALRILTLPAMIPAVLGQLTLAGRGRQLDLDNSWVRLKEPDGVKYGDGSRVREIAFSDAWDDATSNEEPDAVLGQVYRYVLENGGSSGVATFEPIAIAEENPLRTPKPFSQDVLLASDYNLFFEQPANEGYFPAPTVGYSRVEAFTRKGFELWSAAEEARKAAVLGTANVTPPAPGIPVIGPTVYEFYTAKDYPTRATETSAAKGQNPWYTRFIPVPLLGVITLESKTATQGYAIILNDMHGKPKGTKALEFNDDYSLRALPVTATEYVYHDVRRVDVAGEEERDLVNDVDLLKDDADVVQGLLGQKTDIFVDLRSSRAESWDGGLSVNGDVVWAFIPFNVPAFIPNVSYSFGEVKTAVVNKIIHRSGLLKETVAIRGRSRLSTRNLAFDEQTGAPLLTGSENAFGGTVYDYNLPAHWSYAGMRPAYYNAGARFNLSSVPEIDSRGYFAVEQAAISGIIGPGDEFAVRNSSSGESFRAVVVEVMGPDTAVFKAERETEEAGDDFLLVRSGYRNLMDAFKGNIQALSNPLVRPDPPSQCPITYDVPCEDCYQRRKVPRITVQARDLLREFVHPRLSFEDPGPAARQVASRVSRDACFDLGSAKTRGGMAEWPASTPRGQRACQVSLVDGNGQRVRPQELTQSDARAALNAPPKARASSAAGTDFTGVVLTSAAESLGVGDVYVFANFYGWVEAVDVYDLWTGEMCEKTYVEEFDRIRDVLQATATRWEDKWPVRDDDLQFGPQDAEVRAHLLFKSSFGSGAAGIWRPAETYTYVTARRQSSVIDLRQDGAFEEFLHFNWESEELAKCAPNWRMTRNFTRYSPHAFQLEERNILDIYSAALYGHRGSVPIAVATNATNDEIGFEGFEEYEPGQDIPEGYVGSGNIDFSSQCTQADGGRPHLRGTVVDVVVSNHFARIMPEISNSGTSGRKGRTVDLLGGDGLTVLGINDQSVAGFTFYPTERCIPIGVRRSIGPAYSFSVSGWDRDKGVLLLGDPLRPGVDMGLGSSIHGSSLGRSEMIPNPDGPLPPEEPCPFGGIPPFCVDPGGVPDLGLSTEVCIGKGVIEEIPDPTFSGGLCTPIVGVTDVKAHTGTRSLRVDETSAFEQKRLALKAGKRYVVSAWISRDSIDAATFQGPDDQTSPGLRITFAPSTGKPDAVFLPSGPIVEGWQRVEGEFEAAGSTVGLVLQTGLTDEAGPVYFDDIRVFPVDARLESYVYDREDFNLVASLDENNFATLYDYDDDGTLYLVRKETVRGLQAVQETRAHLRERVP